MISGFDVSYIAQRFHEEYEVAAARSGWETHAETRVPWHEVPDTNKVTMLATVRALLEAGVIQVGDTP